MEPLVRRALLLLLVVVMPTAAAGAVSGDLRVDGPIVFAEGATAAAAPLGYFLGDTPNLTRLTLTASSADITRHEHESVVAGPMTVALEDRSARYTLTDLRLDVVAVPRPGWVGAAFAPEARGEATLGARAEVVSARDASIGHTQRVGDDDASRAPYFGVSADDAALVLRSEGAWTIRGDVSLHVIGPTVRLAAAENDTTIATGQGLSPPPMTPTDEAPGAPPTKRVARWLVVEARDVTLHLASTAPAAVLASDATVATTRAWFASAEGTLHDGWKTYDAGGESTVIAGDLHLRLTPTNVKTDTQTRVVLGGDLVSAGTDARIAPVPANAAGLPLFLITGVVSAAAAGAFAWRFARRRDGPRLSVEQCEELAAEAAADERWHDALEWLRKARASAPTSARLACDEAFFLSRLGLVDEALEVYDEAEKMPGGEQAVLLACIFLVRVGSHSEAAARLARGIRRSPSLALDAEDDEELRPLLNDRRVRDARRGAP